MDVQSAVDDVKVVELRRVSPPPGSVPLPTTLTLTYFDVVWLSSPPVQHLFFYEFSGTTQDFRDSHFAQLQRSLSLALALFYPLAGRLVPSPDSYTGDRVIRLSEGDSVPLSLAESTADFVRLVGNQPKRVEEFRSLVPALIPAPSSEEQKKESPLPPLAAFQVTVFPRRGVSVGFTVRHVVADGFGCTHFLKSWASIFKAGGDVSVARTLPIYDRALVGDMERLKRDWVEFQTRKGKVNGTVRASSTASEIVQPSHFTRSTFELSRAQIQKLRDRVRVSSARCPGVGPRVPIPSSFTVAVAHAWVCFAKSRDMLTTDGGPPPAFHFCFAVDCRPRLDPPVPGSYFGNCIGSTQIEASYAELAGEDGLLVATELIQAAIRRLDKGLLGEIDYAFRESVEVHKYRALSVAGTPRFGVYETDFGWGRPRKVEIVSIDLNEAISLAESRDQQGGIEIGVVGPQDEILRFALFFQKGLRAP
ncbi:hypothetical protein H6P81_011115 [Aristolochia fimbriata]|uniref:Uncharacterized protein n=1 Tax=Aristolochia fimbriata TaxID=158543 RepID=A0AAV7ESS7_ARIFI|nr:hypothetical protein H6P81_011115 [Aristolochia fimbriata]